MMKVSYEYDKDPRYGWASIDVSGERHPRIVIHSDSGSRGYTVDEEGGLMLRFTELEQLEVGDIFYEEVYGNSYKFWCKSKPIVVEGYVSWLATNYDGELTVFLVTRGLEHYGPKLYREALV